MQLAARLTQHGPVAAAARELGVTRQSLHAWVRRYIHEPLRAAGHDPPRRLTRQQIWAIVVARTMHLQGEQHAARDAMRFLCGLAPGDIQAAFEAGRTCLLIVAGRFIPRLFTPETITSGLADLLHDAEVAGHHVSTLRLDVQPLLSQILEAARHG